MNGKWIGARMTLEDRMAPIFKKEFSLAQVPEKAMLRICGLGLFELRINGQLPDDSVLNPANTQYTQRVLYCEYDVAHILKKGHNLLTVELGCGFYNENSGVWNWQIAKWRSAPCLWLELDMDGEQIVTDESWLVTLEGRITFNSIYQGETYDARKRITNWQSVELVEGPKGQLCPQTMPPIRRIARVIPAAQEKLADGTYLITMPEMVTGWAKLYLDAPRDEEITITYGEALAEDKVQRIGKNEGPEGGWWPDCYLQQDHFISDGYAGIFEPKFSYKGFEYIEISGYSGELRSQDIEVYRVANDVENRSAFRCSDPMINQLHDMMRRTLLNNFQGKPTDTPVWEKNGWLGDANCGLASMMYNFNMGEYFAAFLDTMEDCLNEYGQVPVMVPTADWQTENSPVWNTVFVFGALALLDYCGMREKVAQLYPALRRFARQDIEEIRQMGWIWQKDVFCDWVSPMNGESLSLIPMASEGSEIGATAFIYGMLGAMIQLSEQFGSQDEVAEYENARKEIYQAFNARFYRDGYYETTIWEPAGNRQKYRQTSNILPLAFGLAQEKEKVLEKLVEDIRRRDYHLDTGCAGTMFLLPVLCDGGYVDVAQRLLTQTTYPSWGFWLTKGATSAWESWELTARSHNHYFLATYEGYLYSHIAGIRNIKDGYARFDVCPALECGLSWAETVIDTPMGLVRCSWHIDEKVYVEIEVPKGATASICLEYAGKKLVQLAEEGICQYTIEF
ncbi:MAG: family 78 glycoside hydrolase catalytic domain [Firmicutes bacterium]|nr:family 78 glycoside hydrolase catalytic domain [Bacillota bacterium]